MTSNKVCRAKDSGVRTPGFILYPGTIDNYARHARSTISVFTHLGFTVRVRPADMNTDHAMAGWWSSFASFRLISNRTLTVACYSGGTVGGAASDVIPFDPIGEDIWFKGEVRCSDAMCSYWYSLDDVEDPSLVTWIPLGTPIGTRPGLTPSTSNSGTLMIGATSPTGSTGLFSGRIYYFSEQQSQVDAFAVNFHDKTTLPSTVLISNSPVNIPGVVFHADSTLVPEELKDWYTGSTRAWPLRVGQPLTVDGIPDIYKGDERVWPGGDGYVSFSGVDGNFLWTPSRPDLTLTDVCVVAKIRPILGAADTHNIVSKWEGNNNRSFRFSVVWSGTTAQLEFRWSHDGITAQIYLSDAFSLASGAWKWVASTFDADDGAGKRALRYWLSDDGVNWTQIGSTLAPNGTTPISLSPTAPLLIGAYSFDFGLYAFNGDIANVSVYNGVGAGSVVGGGTEVFRLDRDSFKAGCRATQLSAKVNNKYLDVSTDTKLAVSTGDPGPLPTDYTFVFKIQGPMTGSVAVPYDIVSQFISGGTDCSWMLKRTAFGASPPTMIFYISTTGTTSATGVSPTITNGPSGENEIFAFAIHHAATMSGTVYHSLDNGVTFQQIGTISRSNLVPFDSALPVRIGTSTTSSFPGRIYFVELRSGLDPLGGSVLWRFDAAEVPAPSSFLFDDSLDTDGNLDGVADGWTGYINGTVVSASRSVINGAQHLEASLESQYCHYSIEHSIAQRFAAAPGPIWIAVEYAATLANDSFNLSVGPYDAGGGSLTGASFQVAATYASTARRRFVSTWTLPAGTASVGLTPGLYHSASTPSGGVVSKLDIWSIQIGSSPSSYVDLLGRTWDVPNPLAVNTLLALEPIVAVNRAGSPAATIYPTVSEMKARWGKAQWNDGTKWSA